MSYPTNGSSVYREILVNTASPVGLTVMLYEGAVKFLRQAIDDMSRKDYAGKSKSIDRAMAIVQYLQGTLDINKGQKIASDLDNLYSYVSTRIFEGSAKLDVSALEEAIHLLETLLSAWNEIARNEQKNSASVTDLLAGQATNQRFQLHA